MDFKLEVIGIPVSDVDAAKAFYTEQVGFDLDHDIRPGNGMRVVQMTPPGSSCSVVIGDGMPLGQPGSKVLQAHACLLRRPGRKRLAPPGGHALLSGQARHGRQRGDRGD